MRCQQRSIVPFNNLSTHLCYRRGRQGASSGAFVGHFDVWLSDIKPCAIVVLISKRERRAATSNLVHAEKTHDVWAWQSGVHHGALRLAFQLLTNLDVIMRVLAKTVIASSLVLATSAKLLPFSNPKQQSIMSEVGLSDVMGLDRSINVFAGFTREFHAIDLRRDVY